MVDLWYNAPPPPPLACFNPDAAVITIGSAGKSFWGAAHRLDPRQHANNRLAYSGPRLSGLGYAAAGAAGLQLAAGKRRHAAAAATEMLKASRDMCEELMKEYFPRWRFTPPEGGLFLGWNSLTC